MAAVRGFSAPTTILVPQVHSSLNRDPRALRSLSVHRSRGSSLTLKLESTGFLDSRPAALPRISAFGQIYLTQGISQRPLFSGSQYSAPPPIPRDAFPLGRIRRCSIDWKRLAKFPCPRRAHSPLKRGLASAAGLANLILQRGGSACKSHLRGIRHV